MSGVVGLEWDIEKLVKSLDVSAGPKTTSGREIGTFTNHEIQKVDGMFRNLIGDMDVGIHGVKVFEKRFQFRA